MELKSVIDQISKDRNIKKELVILAVKSALLKVVQKKHPHAKIEAEYDEKTGILNLIHFKKVVESEPEMLDEETEINLPEARQLDPEAQIDDEIGQIISTDLGRIDANIAKHVVQECIMLAEHEKAYNDYLPFKGKVVSGTVQGMDFRGLMVNLGKIEGYIPKHQLVKTEHLHRGQNVDVLLQNIESIEGRTRITLSRSAPELVVALFAEEVPEIADGSVRVRGCVREAGNKSKLLVDTVERINPVAACIGTAGYKIGKVQHRLGGERIDVVEYTENKVNLLQNLLGKIRLSQVEESEKQISAQVEKDDLAKAIGKSGVNIRLAEQVLGVKLNIKEKVRT